MTSRWLALRWFKAYDTEREVGRVGRGLDHPPEAPSRPDVKQAELSETL